MRSKPVASTDSLALTVYSYGHSWSWPEVAPGSWRPPRPPKSIPKECRSQSKATKGDCLFVGPGSTKKGIQCKFVAQWQGNLIAIVDRDWCGENQASMFGGFHSVYPMFYGHDNADVGQSRETGI
jgi:hypothetical protein